MSIPPVLFAKLMHKLQPSFLHGLEPETAEALGALADPSVRLVRETAEALAVAFLNERRHRLKLAKLVMRQKIY